MRSFNLTFTEEEVDNVLTYVLTEEQVDKVLTYVESILDLELDPQDQEFFAEINSQCKAQIK